MADRPPGRGKSRQHLSAAFGGAFELGKPSRCVVYKLPKIHSAPEEKKQINK